MNAAKLFRFVALLLLLAGSTLPATAQVRLAWTARYQGPDGLADTPHGLLLCPDRGVVVAGTAGYTNGIYRLSELVTLKYSADGRLLWQVPYRSGPTSYTFEPRIAMDAAGNTYVAALTATNAFAEFATPALAVVKYDASGRSLWVSHLRDALAARPSDVQVDMGGQLHIHATFGSSTGTVYLTLKLDSAGQLLWAREYAGPARQDQSSRLTLDTQGNVFVTGRSPAANGINDIATLKYASDGTRLWLRRFAAADPLAGDLGNDLVLDGHNHLYVAGGGTLGFLTLKYTAEGESLWTTNRPNEWGDGAASFIAVDHEGNTLVAGTTSSSGSAAWLLLKYTSDGRLLWSRLYQHPAGFDDYLGSMVVDDSGAAYLTGSSVTNVFGKALLVTAKFSPDGTELWRVNHPSAVRPFGTGHAITLDKDGSVYVTAAARDLSPNDDILIAKYSQARPAAELLSARFGDGRNFVFTLFAEAGYSYAVESSPDLLSWTPVTNFFNSTGTLSFTDPSADGTSPRFYRAVR